MMWKIKATAISIKQINMWVRNDFCKIINNILKRNDALMSWGISDLIRTEFDRVLFMPATL